MSKKEYSIDFDYLWYENPDIEVLNSDTIRIHNSVKDVLMNSIRHGVRLYLPLFLRQIAEKAKTKKEYDPDKGEYIDVVDKGWIVALETEIVNRFGLCYGAYGTKEEPNEAIAFSEWLQKNRWYTFENGKWCYTFEGGTSIDRKEYEKYYMRTSEQLFQLFTQEKYKQK